MVDDGELEIVGLQELKDPAKAHHKSRQYCRSQTRCYPDPESVLPDRMTWYAMQIGDGFFACGTDRRLLTGSTQSTWRGRLEDLSSGLQLSALVKDCTRQLITTS